MIPAASVEAAAKAMYDLEPLHGFPSGEVISWDELTAGAFAKRGLMMEQARVALEAAHAALLALADERDSALGSIRSHITTYELRQLLGATDD